VGHLVRDLGDRLVIAFADGAERTLLEGVPGLVELEDDGAPPLVSTADALRKLRASTLIKAFRIAVRDALLEAKSTAGYPDDTLVEMQKGLSRVTADHARFLGTKPDIVRRASAPTARELRRQHGSEPLFEHLAERLEELDARHWPHTRAFADPIDAAEHVRALLGFVDRGPHLEQDDLDALEGLLRLPDRREPEDALRA
jgi:hypothetical protein